MPDLILDAGDQCVWCNQDTSFGSGRFVDRIPVSTEPEAVDWLEEEDKGIYDFVEGYGCTDCYQEDDNE
jgi:hypothetical protein